MTPEQSRAFLEAVLLSMEGWVEELRGLEGCCPQRVVHLRAAVEQAHMALSAVLAQDGEGRE